MSNSSLLVLILTVAAIMLAADHVVAEGGGGEGSKGYRHHSAAEPSPLSPLFFFHGIFQLSCFLLYLSYGFSWDLGVSRLPTFL